MHSAVYMYFHKCASNQRSTVEIKRNQRSKCRQRSIAEKGGQTVTYTVWSQLWLLSPWERQAPVVVLCWSYAHSFALDTNTHAAGQTGCHSCIICCHKMRLPAHRKFL